MSLLIKGMDMPKSCYDCDFAYQDQDSEHNVYWTCAIVHKDACMYERRDDCPLVEVPPPHGRLIDADALYKSFGASGNCNKCDMDAYKCQYYNEHTMMEFCELIDDAPTIVEAEGE